jgi:hypothetical protein
MNAQEQIKVKFCKHCKHLSEGGKRLFLETSDVQLNWKKILRLLPGARRYALDRMPTIEELHEILGA